MRKSALVAVGVTLGIAVSRQAIQWARKHPDTPIGITFSNVEAVTQEIADVFSGVNQQRRDTQSSKTSS